MSGITFNTSYKKKPQQKIILYNVAKPMPVHVPVQVPVQAPVQAPVILSNSNISITDKIKEQYLKKNIII